MATESIPTLETETMNNEILGETTDYPKYTTRDQEQLTATTTELSTSTDAGLFDLSTSPTQDPFDEEAGESTSLSDAYLREVSTTLADAPTETSTTGAGTSSSNELEAATAVDVTVITEVPELASVTIVSVEKSERNDAQGQEHESTSTEKVHLETTSSINLNTTTSSATSTKVSTAKTPTANITTTDPSKSYIAVEKEEASQTTRTTKKTTTTTTMTATTRTSTIAIKGDAKKAPAKEKEKIKAPEEMSVISVKKPSSGLSTSIIVPDDMLVMNVTVKTNVAVGHIHGVTINPIGKPIPPDIVTILNITNRRKGEDYDYDYSEPTLPPSLPNVRIIPFVAADALVKDKDVGVVPSAVTGYPTSAVAVSPELGPTDTNFYDIVTQKNRFTPPEKTEGGFVPREPPYFDPLFHSSDLNLEIGTGVTVVPELISVPNVHRKTDQLHRNCLYEEDEYGHGQILPNRALCVTCICYYGEIVCSNKKCPPLKIGCQRVNDPNDKCCSKIVCVKGVESPTVVLDRLDSTSSSHHEPTVSPDPFRDVIKTEPAPDLPSLIGDMMIPYLVEHSITTPVSGSGSGIAGSSNVVDLPPKFIVASHNDSRSGVHGEMGKAPEKSDRNFVSQHIAGNFSADDVTLTSPDVNPIIKDDGPGEEEDSIFSLDGVLDVFFNEPSTGIAFNETTTRVSPTTANSTKAAAGKKTTTPTTGTAATASPPSSTSTETTNATTTTTTTTPTEMSSSSMTPVDRDSMTGGLLKLAGCNIYGKMYSVGRIITELSNQCRECRCTELGVQCESLDC